MGAIYAIQQNGDMLFYQHAGFNDGSANWPISAKKIGEGWNFKQVFAGDTGAIYAIQQNGDMLFYKHAGFNDGSANWPISATKIGNGWSFKQVFASLNTSSTVGNVPDCSKEAQLVAEIEGEIASLQADTGGNGGALHGNVQLIRAAQARLATAKAALNKCLNTSTISTLQPRYMVTNLLYNPPGIGSQATYGAGSTTGVTTQVTNNFRPGLTVSTSGGFLGNGIDASGAFSLGPKDGNAVQMQKSQISTLSIQSQQDVIDHLDDLFYVWTNIVVEAAQKPDQSISLSVGILGEGQQLDIVPLTGAELRNPALIPAAKKAFLTGFTPADYQAIAALNPLMAGTPIDPGRYRYLQTFHVYGPDNPGDPIPGAGTQISDQNATSDITGFTTQLNVAATLSTGFNVGIAGASLNVGLTFEWDYEWSKNVSSGTQESVTVNLQSSTVGYQSVVDVYQDTMFKSLAYVASPQPPDGSVGALTGTVQDAQGRPLFNQRVDVALPNGQRHTTFTNAQGIYRLTLPAQGQGRIEVNNIVKTVALTAGPIAVAFP
jgi:Tachylectin